MLADEIDKKIFVQWQKTSNVIYNGQINLIQEYHKNFLEFVSFWNRFLYKMIEVWFRKEDFQCGTNMKARENQALVPSLQIFVVKYPGQRKRCISTRSCITCSLDTLSNASERVKKLVSMFWGPNKSGPLSKLYNCKLLIRATDSISKLR
jgi:hypothetical protein